MNNEIGIITLVGKFNYGNRLQAYATYRIYERLGFSPVLLDLKDRRVFKRDLKRAIKRLLGRKGDRPEDAMSDERLEAFDRFNALMTSRFIAEIDRTLNDGYRAFSVGSDQVWNPDYMLRKEDWFFLEFSDREKRIALAPSIGVEQLSVKQLRRLAKGVSGFPRLSIRERAGQALIAECSGREAKVICDPTLVLEAEEWRKVSSNRLTPQKPYVFTYLLGEDNSKHWNVVDAASRGGALPVVALSDRERPGEPPAGPAEFLSLIENAVHVVTDSYHAAVFSAIFETPLTIVRRGGGGHMFSRLETLTAKLGIEDKIYDASRSTLEQASCYEGVSRVIDQERRVFLGYLSDCIDSQHLGC